MYGKEEVQLVDMVLRIRAKLSEAASQKMPLPDIVKERLEKHVSTIVKTLPSDLQTVLQKGTILNVDKNSNSSSNCAGGRNSNERTIDILENTPEKENNALNDPFAIDKNNTVISKSTLNISEISGNQSAQTKDELSS